MNASTLTEAGIHADVAVVIVEFCSSLKVTDADAMRGKCMIHSTALAEKLNGMVVVDSYDLDNVVEAYTGQLWNVPASLVDNEMAHGHYVTTVVIDGQRFFIDVTQAQFGASGPGFAVGGVPAVLGFDCF